MGMHVNALGTQALVALCQALNHPLQGDRI